VATSTTTAQAAKERRAPKRIFAAVAVAISIAGVVVVLHLLAHPFYLIGLGHTVFTVRPIGSAAVSIGTTIIASPPIPRLAPPLEQVIAAIQRTKLHGKEFIVVETRNLHGQVLPWRMTLPHTVYVVTGTLPQVLSSVFITIHRNSRLLDLAFIGSVVGLLLFGIATARWIQLLMKRHRASSVAK
jgi:hypothetical protein